LCFNWAPCHEGVLEEWRYSSTHSLTSAQDGGEWLASQPSCFTPRERAPGTHWIGGSVGPRAILDTVMKKKIPSPYQESSPRTPIIQPVQDWRKLHNVKFHHFYSSPHVVRVVRSIRVRWTWHIAYMRKQEMHKNVWLKDSREEATWQIYVQMRG
jgi:hypothetical protein